VCGLSIIAWPKGADGKPDPKWKPGTDTISDIRPGQLRDRAFEDKQRKPDDMEAQEGQRRIAIHALENLGSSDIGVSLLRRTLREAMRAVREGREPQNLIRDPEQNHALDTSCWNTVMTPEQFDQMKPTMPAEAVRRQKAAEAETA
jgi:hypothetical protein